MKVRATAVFLAGSVLLLSGCGSGQPVAPSAAIIVPTTIVSRATTTVTVTATTTLDPAAEAAASSAASASSVAAAGGAEFQAQLSAAGLTSPGYDQAVASCKYMDAGKDPFSGAGGISLNFDTLIRITDPSKLKGLQVTIGTLCPQHQAALDAAIQKKSDDSAASSAAAAARDQVNYSVTASESGSALITYAEDANFNLSQENGAALPWTKDLTIPAGGFRILSLSAQNSGGGDISCAISVGGQVVDTATSSGDYAIVTCSHDG